jgi:hypothetical protein
VVEEARLWHVTVTVSGVPMEPLIVRAALQRLAEERPFLSSVRFSAERAEIAYWEQAASMLDAASLALRLWNEHRESATLPSWEVIGLEVLERDLRTSRDGHPGLVELAVAAQPR